MTLQLQLQHHNITGLVEVFGSVTCAHAQEPAKLRLPDVDMLSAAYCLLLKEEAYSGMVLIKKESVSWDTVPL